MAVVVPIVSEWNPSGVNKSIADIKSAEGAWGKAGAGIKAAALPAAAALGGLAIAAVDFTKAAIEDQKSAAILASALKQTAGASNEAVASTEAWISAQGKALGVADDQLRPALATLARATGDVAKSQELASLAMNISAATGKDIQSVSVGLAKAYAGQGTALKKLVPGLDEAVLASGDFAAIQAELASKVGNAADVAANTAAGKMQRFSLAMTEAKESIGYALLPAVEALLGPLQGLGEFVQNNTQLILIFGGIIAGLAAAILAVNAVMAAWGAITKIVTIAQAALNLALSLNPIGLVVIAIAALVAGLVIAYNKSETFRNIVDAVWTALKNSTVAVFGAIKNVILTVWEWMKTLFSFTPVGVLITHWETFRDVTVAIWDAVYSAIETVVNKIKAIIDAVVGKITDAIKKAKEFASSIPFIGGLFGSDAPTLNSSSSYLLNASSSPAVGAASPAVSITVNAGVGDPVQIARAIENTLRTRNIRLGLA